MRPAPGCSAAARGGLRLSLSLGVGAAAIAAHYSRNKLTCTAAVQVHPKISLTTSIAKIPKEADAVESPAAQTWWDALESWFHSAAQYVRVCYRMAYCTTVVSSVAWLAPWILTFQDKEALYVYIIRCIEHLGPTFIKLAQWASSRPDLFDEELIVHLVRLQDSTAIYPLAVTHATLAHEFGSNWSDTLSIDPVPIGSGCIAQVRSEMRPAVLHASLMLKTCLILTGL